jgi:hypothetical protein
MKQPLIEGDAIALERASIGGLSRRDVKYLLGNDVNEVCRYNRHLCAVIHVFLANDYADW